MKILVDTNIIFSAILNEKSSVAKTLFYANKKHELYLSTYNIQEIKEVINKKIPHKLSAIERFLSGLDYKIISCEKKIDNTHENIIIRDIKDQPILNSAIRNDIDIILTGDKDFLALNLDKPSCMSVADFCSMENIYF